MARLSPYLLIPLAIEFVRIILNIKYYVVTLFYNTNKIILNSVSTPTVNNSHLIIITHLRVLGKREKEPKKSKSTGGQREVKMTCRYKIVKREIDMVTFPRIASIPNGISCSINEMPLALISDFYLMEKKEKENTQPRNLKMSTELHTMNKKGNN